MKKKIMLSVATLSLAGLMAVPAFASEDIGQNFKFSWRTDRQTTIETIAEKVGVPAEELLEKKEAGESCEDLLDTYGLNFEEIKEARLAEQFKIVDEKVAAGIMTEEEGKAIKEKIESYRFLQDGKGPHRGQREGMQLNMQGNAMRNNGGRGPRFER